MSVDCAGAAATGAGAAGGSTEDLEFAAARCGEDVPVVCAALLLRLHERVNATMPAIAAAVPRAVSIRMRPGPLLQSPLLEIGLVILVELHLLWRDVRHPRRSLLRILRHDRGAHERERQQDEI